MNNNSQQEGGVKLFSPAKLNLFFRVLHKRPDSFHEIASLYQAINLGDILQICLSDEDRLICNEPEIPTDSSNLVWKAIDSFRKNTGKNFKVHVQLQKKIPVQAGLGGGSSNAATALWAVNQLCGGTVAETDLRAFASEFSSDAPFFFSAGTAYCCGRGEVLEAAPSLQPQSLWIVKPKEGLSTPLVYKHCQPEKFQKRNPRDFLQQILKGRAAFFNDLEIPAFQLMPSLQLLKEKLLSLGFSSVTMTGSGTAFFCLGDRKLAPVLEGIQFIPTQYLNRPEGKWYEKSKER